MIRIDTATQPEVPIILSFIRKLGEYEKLGHEVVATEELLRKHLFGAHPKAECLIARWDYTPVGFVIFFHNFSTFLAQPGLYVEDLYVEPEYRRRGIGKALLRRCARLAKDRGCGRLEWSVLDWNEPSIAFYKKIGAVAKDEWTVFRISGDALDTLAAR